MPRTSTITPEKFTTFGELLRFLRRKADLTQRELAAAVGYSESQISRLEQNERAPDETMLAARFVPVLSLEEISLNGPPGFLSLVPPRIIPRVSRKRLRQRKRQNPYSITCRSN